MPERCEIAWFDPQVGSNGSTRYPLKVVGDPGVFRVAVESLVKCSKSQPEGGICAEIGDLKACAGAAPTLDNATGSVALRTGQLYDVPPAAKLDLHVFGHLVKCGQNFFSRRSSQPDVLNSCAGRKIPDLERCKVEIVVEIPVTVHVSMGVSQLGLIPAPEFPDFLIKEPVPRVGSLSTGEGDLDGHG